MTSFCGRSGAPATSFRKAGRCWRLDALAPASERLIGECNDVVTIGRQRTAQQDLRFAIDELVEIASRALSPGVNDPFTAIACIDWLGAALTELDRSPAAPDQMTDESGSRPHHLAAASFRGLSGWRRSGSCAAMWPLTPMPGSMRSPRWKNSPLRPVDGRHRALIEAERAHLSGLAAEA